MIMAYNDTNTARRSTQGRSDAPVSTGIPFWDMMLSLGKVSSQALTGYSGGSEAGARSGQDVASAARRTEADVQVIPVGEETLNVGTRTVQGETVRVRRVVVETPVERDVALREERVIVERRKPTSAASTATQGILSETVAEMTDTYQVAEVWKSVRVTEEVVLRREVTERRETVRDTVRRDEVVVEQAPRALPAPRREAETVQRDHKAVAAPKAEMPDAAKLSADLKQVAERFEAGADQHKAPAPKAEQKSAAPQPQPEPAKASAEQTDKAGGPGRKA